MEISLPKDTQKVETKNIECDQVASWIKVFGKIFHCLLLCFI